MRLQPGSIAGLLDRLTPTRATWNGHNASVAREELLRANGFEPLHISPNYYDDVEARFGLDPDLADRLRAENILYDRDDSGEYFQLYSPNYGEGFFFEIVERRGGYNGYGAPNAPFRIAAQKRHLRPKGMPRT